MTSYLSTHTYPSPPSTLLITPYDLPADAQTQSALVHRILRYVSPHPWGSPESEAGRRHSSIQQILQRVWTSAHNADSNTHTGLGSFTAGAHVLWTPVRLFPNGSFRLLSTPTLRPPSLDNRHMSRPAWLVSRQPPSAQALRTLIIDIDLDAGTRASGSLNVLWDNRFIIRLREELGSGRDGDRLVIRPKGRLVLPKVVHVWEDGEETVQCEVKFIRELRAI